MRRRVVRPSRPPSGQPAARATGQQAVREIVRIPARREGAGPAPGQRSSRRPGHRPRRDRCPRTPDRPRARRPVAAPPAGKHPAPVRPVHLIAAEHPRLAEEAQQTGRRRFAIAAPVVEFVATAIGMPRSTSACSNRAAPGRCGISPRKARSIWSCHSRSKAGRSKSSPKPCCRSPRTVRLTVPTIATSRSRRGGRFSACSAATPASITIRSVSIRVPSRSNRTAAKGQGGAWLPQ